MPSHGTELCTIVETMFSYATLHNILGDAAFAERCESITYNTLPAGECDSNSCGVTSLCALSCCSERKSYYIEKYVCKLMCVHMHSHSHVVRGSVVLFAITLSLQE